MGLFSSISNLFHHIVKPAVHALLPYLEKGFGDFIAKGLPIAETLVISLIKNKGQISTADRDAAASQIKNSLIAEAEGTGVAITDGISKLVLDLAYHKLKFTGAIVPSDNQTNVGIAPTKVDSSTAVVGPPIAK